MEVWTQWVICKVSDAWRASCQLCTGPVAFILPWTLEKWNSSLMFILCFYIIFDHYLWNFDLNLANKRRRKVIIRRVWLLRSTAVTMTWRPWNVKSANQQLQLSMMSLTRNVAWMSVIHGCMNLVGPEQIHLRKLLVSVNIPKCSALSVEIVVDIFSQKQKLPRSTVQWWGKQWH